MQQQEASFENVTINKALLRAGVLTFIAGVMLLLYARGVLQFTAHQMQVALVVILCFVLLPNMVLIYAFHYRFFQRAKRCLDDRAAGNLTPEVLHDGFETIANAPRYWFVWGFFWFLIGCIQFSLIMGYWFGESYPPLYTLVSIGAGVAGGFMFAVTFYFVFKRYLEPLRQQLAQEIGDPEIVHQLIHPVSLRTKLLVSVTGTLLVTTMYATLLGDVRSQRAVEGTAARVGQTILTWGAQQMALHGEAGLDEVRSRALQLGITTEILLIDTKRDPKLRQLHNSLRPHEVEFLLDQGVKRGDSRALDSRNYFSWKQLPNDTRILVAVAPETIYEPDVPVMVGAMGGYLTLAAAVALLVAFLIASDAQRATAKLGREVSRLASGDLTRGHPLVWEDELGSLAGSVDHMADSLRAMVRRVASTADRVDTAAEEIATSTRNVVDVSSDQVLGLDHAKGSMDSIEQQMRGVADSAQALNVSVEDSSSSILEMRSAGETLNDNASMLSGKVDESSSSIEELIRSVRHVLENTESLAGAAVETSSSMEEMAASLREVDTNAAETARLSGEMVTIADGGRVKVQQTVTGMESIREATLSAQSVIHSLGGRAKEIGAIVSVIDDVAEETNLLALNAAIIAAQAGENGRGFSIVADEIKKLADRVLASTKEIAALIQAVQEESANAVGAIEAGAERVQTGVTQAAEAGESLEHINSAARESGSRIGEIVLAVGEQTKAAAHVVSLMERVRTGVEQIRQAGRDQDRGSESILRSTEVMRQIAQQVHGTTGEQARGSGRISESIESVREAMEQINRSLQEQTAACRSAVQNLEAVAERTRSNDESTRDLDESVRRLRADAEKLRVDVQRFRI